MKTLFPGAVLGLALVGMTSLPVPAPPTLDRGWWDVWCSMVPWSDYCPGKIIEPPLPDEGPQPCPVPQTCDPESQSCP